MRAGVEVGFGALRSREVWVAGCGLVRLGSIGVREARVLRVVLCVWAAVVVSSAWI